LNPKQRIFLMLTLSALVMGAGALFNYLVNPYGAWGTAVVDPVFRKVENERLAVPYMLPQGQFDTILVGTSRVEEGMHIDQIERGGMMNAAIRAGTIHQLTEIIEAALRNPKLKRIIWGADFVVFDDRWDHIDADFEARMNGSVPQRIEDTLLNTTAINDGFQELQRAYGGVKKLKPTRTAEVPWPMPLLCDEFIATGRGGIPGTGKAELTLQIAQQYGHFAGYRFSNRLFDRFRQTVEDARRRGVEVILFIPPMSGYEVEMVRQAGLWDVFMEWKRKLVTVGPFYDFSGYNDLAHTDNCFIDVMHFKAATGQAALRLVLGANYDPCNLLADVVSHSVEHVDASNIDKVLAEQTVKRDKMAASNSLFKTMTAEAIERRAKNPDAFVAVGNLIEQ